MFTTITENQPSDMSNNHVWDNTSNITILPEPGEFISMLKLTTDSSDSVKCVVDEWSPFTACSETCGPYAVKYRTRLIVLVPTGGAADCPKLNETKRCGPKKCVSFLDHFLLLSSDPNSIYELILNL